MPTVAELFNLTAAFGASTVAAGGILYFASRFLAKVWVNRLLEQDRARYGKELEGLRQQGQAILERMKHQSEKELLVHRLQFETEFQVYLDLWEKLVVLEARARSLRPMLDSVDPTETEEERKRRRLDELSTAYNEVKEVVFKRRPFYAPDVYEAANSILALAYDEALSYQYPDEKKSEYWRRAQENAKMIAEQIDTTCDAIRERIWSVGVVTG